MGLVPVQFGSITVQVQFGLKNKPDFIVMLKKTEKIVQLKVITFETIARYRSLLFCQLSLL